MPSVSELNDKNFDAVIQSDTPVLVDFWSPACKPCGLLTPILEELASDNEGDAVVAKVNAAENSGLTARYGIDILPTLLFFRNGKVIERMTGVQSKQKLQTALDEIE
ncbi:MAG: thioredoxin [Planctomycetaceae bacterium]|jgi:thioredoxin 1|nr:thioredoxin [Planctomycetaceae bacterium]